MGCVCVSILVAVEKSRLMVSWNGEGVVVVDRAWMEESASAWKGRIERLIVSRVALVCILEMRSGVDVDMVRWVVA